MLTMQYRIVLPTDYPMAIIERRIAERGHLTDGLPGLAFKAYLYAIKGEPGAAANAYAPFYLWRTAEGMRDFLSGPGFAALSESFGRPVVNGAVAWFGEWQGEAEAARHAVIERLPLSAVEPLAARRAAEEGWGRTRLRDENALGAASAFDPAEWSLTRILLLREAPDNLGPGCELYRVGRVSLGAA
ncbi:DUF4865 family protein [Chromobacterium phragmitis]|uniref:DUF4865 family protein n=2 Tax=Chromobacterium amazonense TaxID=1382803 RepID=UPI000583EEE5|nr:DUF4865 family protein [Chromobacterium amazonense]KIA79443.1 hypothetical protein QR66_15870 [Chromobacterium piscinae]MBM2884531.1 DUF4865 family protein [Chromobacterium amazonense]